MTTVVLGTTPPAAFTDYTDLRTAVIEETGAPQIAEVFDRLTRTAEARLNRLLRTRHQIVNATLTVSGGAALLPDDYAQTIGVFDSSGCEMWQAPYFVTGYNYAPGKYAMSGSHLHAPDGTYSLQYYKTITADTVTDSSTATNWLLSNYPSVYIWAVTAEALKHLRRVDEVAPTEMLLDRELREIAVDDGAARYSRTTRQINGATP